MAWALEDHAPTRAPRIVLLDGARTLGAKILVSGGSRCNVTNAHVDTADFWRSGSPFVRQVLRALPVSETIPFFDGIGVTLKEEPLGKLFPTTNKSRTVLDASAGDELPGVRFTPHPRQRPGTRGRGWRSSARRLDGEARGSRHRLAPRRARLRVRDSAQQGPPRRLPSSR
jgi:hypothetical protein